MWTLPWFLKLLLLPPASLFIVALAGLIVYRRCRLLGRGLIGASVLALYLLSTPLVGSRLLHGLEAAPALSADRLAKDVGAIVVLSAGLYPAAPEFGGDTVSATTLQRVRYGAYLHRLSGAPLLVTGGAILRGHKPLGTLMAEALAADFGVAPRWIENQAFNTFQNARFSAEILLPKGIAKVYLVTHAWHMRRSVAVFEAAGFDVVPAPTVLTIPTPFSLDQLIPTVGGLRASGIVIHEWIGLVWYRIAYL